MMEKETHSPLKMEMENDDVYGFDFDFHSDSDSDWKPLHSPSLSSLCIYGMRSPFHRKSHERVQKTSPSVSAETFSWTEGGGDTRSSFRI